MGTAKKLPSGNWHCQVYSHTDENGKRKYKSFTAPTKAEAQRMAAEYAAHKDRMSSGIGMTVEEALDQYIENKTNVLSPSTLRGYKNFRKNHYKSLLKMTVDSVKTSDLQKYVNELAAKKPPKTVKNIYTLLYSALSAVTGISYKVTLPKMKPIERHIPTDKDVAALIKQADGELKLAIVLASVGTLRLGEVCGLSYKDVLRSKNALYVHSDRVMGTDGYVYKEMPKTSESERMVRIPKEVMDMIPDGEPDDHIITVTPNTLDKAFERLRNNLGLKCRFHDLRHYAASIMHAIGIPDVYIMERGGWRTDNVLKSIYRNSLEDKSKEFTDKINDYLADKLLDDNKKEEK